MPSGDTKSRPHDGPRSPLCDLIVSAACSSHRAHLLEQRELGQCLMGALLDLQQPGLPHICIVRLCNSLRLPRLLKLCQAPAAQLLLPDLQPKQETHAVSSTRAHDCR